ncbi:centromere protein K-like [Falco naumanni]|uniref:centromere protein K-like n=1 Tax=Falco naumanni TaxID=148594 RepID=UPI001ADE8911|nr:centromere protein K-like [Falco naumanni]
MVPGPGSVPLVVPIIVILGGEDLQSSVAKEPSFIPSNTPCSSSGPWIVASLHLLEQGYHACPKRSARGVAEKLPEIINLSCRYQDTTVCPVDTKEELLDECESIWKQMEEFDFYPILSHFTPVQLGTIQDASFLVIQLSLLMIPVKALTAEYNQWQKKNPDLISTNPDVLVALGKEELILFLQKVKNYLEMVLSTVQSKNKKKKKKIQREQQWHEKQEQILNALIRIEEDMKKQVVITLDTRAFQELKNKMLKLTTSKEELLHALDEFLEHFPLPQNGGSAKKKKNSYEKPAVQLITLHEILEVRWLCYVKI